MGREKNAIIDINRVMVGFNLANQKIDNIKEYFVKIIKRELMSQRFFALKDISFQIKRGEAWGLVGTNGSDRSTLLKAISEIVRPFEGSVTVNGSIAPLIELGAGLDGNLTTEENIFLNGCLLGHNEKHMQGHLDEIVDFAELWDFPDSPIKNHSSGMRARLGSVIATMAKSDVFIVDEILTVGDFKFRQKCQARMNEMLSDGTTLLFASHSISEALELCDHVIWLDRGKTIMLGKTGEVCNLYMSK